MWYTHRADGPVVVQNSRALLDAVKENKSASEVAGLIATSGPLVDLNFKDEVQLRSGGTPPLVLKE